MRTYLIPDLRCAQVSPINSICEKQNNKFGTEQTRFHKN